PLDDADAKAATIIDREKVVTASMLEAIISSRLLRVSILILGTVLVGMKLRLAIANSEKKVAKRATRAGISHKLSERFGSQIFSLYHIKMPCQCIGFSIKLFIAKKFYLDSYTFF